MTLPLNKEVLQAAYEFVRSTEPFCKWNLPDGEDMLFRVTRSKTTMGEYYVRDGKHIIAISSRLVGHTKTLIEIMAHECVHLHQNLSCMETSGMHNAAFQKLAAKVCKTHGFDPKVF